MSCAPREHTSSSLDKCCTRRNPIKLLLITFGKSVIGIVFLCIQNNTNTDNPKIYKYKYFNNAGLGALESQRSSDMCKNACILRKMLNWVNLVISLSSVCMLAYN